MEHLLVRCPKAIVIWFVTYFIPSVLNRIMLVLYQKWGLCAGIFGSTEIVICLKAKAVRFQWCKLRFCPPGLSASLAILIHASPIQPMLFLQARKSLLNAMSFCVIGLLCQIRVGQPWL